MLAVVRALPNRNGSGAPSLDPLAPVDAEAEGLLARLATHDWTTELHCRRVATWSERIATAMDRSPEEIAFAARCGLLHDIGKLFTPLSILHKVGPLTSRQQARMQDHVTEGAELLGSISVLEPYVDVVGAHHERFDGSGYPHSLAGEGIPLDARVVAVADAFDAMISGRPYREAIRPVQALEELHRFRGTHFDPAVVDTLIRILNGHIGRSRRTPDSSSASPTDS